MFERFDTETREKVRRAAELAEAEQAAMVEAEHILAALVDPVNDSIGHILEAAGISSEGIRAARDREFHSALAIAGVTTTRPSPASAPRLRRGRTTRFGPSAKLTVARSLAHADGPGRHRRITTTCLALALIEADVGIMPRLLDEMDVEHDGLLASIRGDR